MSYCVGCSRFDSLAEALAIAKGAGLALYSPIRRCVIWRPPCAGR